MATLSDPGVRELLEQPNYAVVSTHNQDGSIHNTIVWIAVEDDAVSINSAVGRKWPTNLERDHNVTVLVQEAGNPYHYVEIRGTANGSTDEADEHVNRLTRKYMGQDEYPFRQPGEQRIKFMIQPRHIRHLKM